MSETAYVLDASALLALVFDEPGADRVAAALSGARMSAVNVTEVVTRLIDRGTTEEIAAETIAAFDVEIVDFDAEQAVLAGLLRRITRACGLSLGDRACIALANSLNLPVMTTDRAWARAALPVAVDLIR